MLETFLTGLVMGVVIPRLGVAFLPAIGLYLAFRLSQRPTLDRRTIGLGLCLGLLGFSVGLLRSPHIDSYENRDGTRDQLRGHSPAHTTTQTPKHLIPVQITNTPEPTFRGFWQDGVSNQGSVRIYSLRTERPFPVGTVLIAHCNSHRKGNQRFACEAVSDGTLRRSAPNLRDQIAFRRLEVIDTFLGSQPTSSRRLAAALASGSRSVVPRVDVDRLARMGLLHLWAVSGLHVAIFAGAFVWLLRRLWFQLWPGRTRPAPLMAATLLAVPLVGLYGLFCGLGPSVIRAQVAFSLFAVLLWSRRTICPRTILLGTITLELALPISALTRPGAILSHCAILGIVVSFTKTQHASTNRLLRYFGPLLRVSAAATLATAPAQIFYFSCLAPAGLLIGLFLIPWVSLVALPLATLTSLAIIVGLPHSLRDFLATSCSHSIAAAEYLIHAVDQPGLRITVSSDLAPVAAFLAVLALGCSSLKRLPLWRRMVWPSLGLCLAILVSVQTPKTPHTALTAFNVGHGDAFLIQTSDGFSILVDAGPGYPNGQRTPLSPERLRRAGINKIDFLILTHRHPDHYGGAFRVLRDIPVSHCLIADVPPLYSTSDWDHLLDLMTRVNCTVLRLKAGETISIGKSRLDILWPAQNSQTAVSLATENDRSLMAHLQTPDGSIWISGDPPQAVETQAMALSPTKIPGGVLLVPHHGSRTSSSPALLDSIQPSAGLVSHRRSIAADVLQRYKKRHIPLCGTRPGGTVRIQLKSGKILLPWGCKP